jgi:hypothetical protein
MVAIVPTLTKSVAVGGHIEIQTSCPEGVTYRFVILKNVWLHHTLALRQLQLEHWKTVRCSMALLAVVVGIAVRVGATIAGFLTVRVRHSVIVATCESRTAS